METVEESYNRSVAIRQKILSILQEHPSMPQDIKERYLEQLKRIDNVILKLSRSHLDINKN